MPIILNTGKKLWLVGGKTRLGTANYIKGIPAKVWMLGGKQSVAEDLTENKQHFEYLDQWEQAVIAAWANSARIERITSETYAARLPNNRLVGEYNQDQGGWVESPGSADMDEQAVAEGRDATDAEHKKAMDTLFKRPDVVAMSRSLKRRDRDPEYDARQKQEFQKRLSKKKGVAEQQAGNAAFLPKEIAALNQYLDDEISFIQLRRGYPGVISKAARQFGTGSTRSFQGEMDFYDRMQIGRAHV